MKDNSVQEIITESSTLEIPVRYSWTKREVMFVDVYNIGVYMCNSAFSFWMRNGYTCIYVYTDISVLKLREVRSENKRQTPFVYRFSCACRKHDGTLPGTSTML